MGNNLLAAGPGIPTTLGALEDDSPGEVEINYSYRREGQPQLRAQRTRVTDLRGQNVLALVREVLSVCREDGEAIDGIDLSAVGESAGSQRGLALPAGLTSYWPLAQPTRAGGTAASRWSVPSWPRG